MTIETLDNISCDIEPVADSHLANKAYVDAAVANGAGTASVSGDSVVSIPAHSLISCDIEPTEDSHLVNKAYVDAAVAAAGTATPIEEPAALGRVVVVDTLSDAASHTGTSLRDAIDAVTDKGSVVIKFSVSGTITLEQGEIVIPVGNISIDGEDKITISGGGVSRVFSITNAYTLLSLHRLIVTGGNGVGGTDSQINGGAILLKSTASAFHACKCTFRENYISATSGSTKINGGAIYASTGSLSLVQCTFVGNYINNTGTSGGAFGGAVTNACQRCVVRNCSFTGNYVAGDSGGFGGAWHGVAIISDCTFSNNSCMSTKTNYGGAISSISNEIAQQININRCVFTGNYTTGGNSGSAGGAVYTSYCYQTWITECTFNNNTAYYGCAIYTGGTTGRSGYSATIKRCLFSEEVAPSGGRAAAIYIYYQSATIEDCEFINNVDNTASGIIYVYGYTDKVFQVTINRCKFTGNSSSAATTGLVYCANLSQVYLYNTVFTANSFTATTGNHKCVYTTGSSNAFIYNCTFTNNTNKGGAFYAASGSVDIYNSVEYGNESASGKGSSATVNAAKFLSDQSASVGRDIAYDSTKPLFAADGFTPVANSQVIDAGNDTYVMTEYDLPGKERVSGTKVDLGAVEYQQVS